MELKEVIETRRSVRRFKDIAISDVLCSCFVGYLDIPSIDKILDLPENITCLYLLPVGYPDETPKPKRRKSLSEIVFYDRWGNR